MIVIDTSALVSILWQETDSRSLSRIVAASEGLCIGAPNALELYLVTAARYGATAGRKAIRSLQDLSIEIVAFTPDMATIAFDAFEQFGKGRHKAALNFGDCMAYALAKSLDAPLLYKGNDFALTDLRSAVGT